MKIAFWSNVRGKCATSSNIAGIGVMNALMNSQDMVLFENHLSLSGIHNYLERPEALACVRERNYYFNNIGMEPLIKKVLTCKNNELGRNYALGFMDNKLFYVPNQDVVNKEVFSYELNNSVLMVMEALEKEFGCVIADVSGESNLSTKVILDETDRIVVSFPQDRKIIDDFFEKYTSIVDKCVFIISCFEPDVRLREDYICGRYRIKKNRIGVIPYNFEFREALMQGNIVDFITKNYNCKRRDYNFYFINELKRTCEMVLGNAYE